MLEDNGHTARDVTKQIVLKLNARTYEKIQRFCLNETISFPEFIVRAMTFYLKHLYAAKFGRRAPKIEEFISL